MPLDDLTPQDQQPQETTSEFDPTPLIKDGKWLGKYNSAADVERGYFEAVNTMNQTKQQLDMALNVIQAYQQQAQGPGQPQTRPVYEENLDKLGVPVSDLDAMIRDRASRIAQEYIQQQFQPMIMGTQARETMANQFPDYQENERKVMEFVRSNPELKAEFNELMDENRPLAALKLGYYGWKMAQVPSQSPDVQNAKRAAGMPAAAGGTGRTSGMQRGASQAETDAAVAEFRKGNAVPLFDIKLRDIPLTYTEQMEALMRERS